MFSPRFSTALQVVGEKIYQDRPIDGNRHGLDEQEMIDVAFRVIGDHIRTICFSIADGIEPGYGDRNYVIRNILRRAVRFGRILGFDAENPFLHKLAPVVFKEFGDVFPELKDRKERILALLEAEEKQFNKTLDRGLKLFNEAAEKISDGEIFPPETVVKLWETFGFPTDLTQLLLDERELKTDKDEVARLVEIHKETGGRGAGASVVAAVKIDTDAKTEFVGYDVDETEAEVLEWIENEDGVFAIVDKSPFYIEKGGQQGDTGELIAGEEKIGVLNVLGVGEATVLQLDMKPDTATTAVTLKVDTDRRRAIEDHHTATHLFHWALHEAVSPDATQQGSLVAPDRLRFDFNCEPLTNDQIFDIEAMVNRCIQSDDPVTVNEVPHKEIADNPDVMQFFDDKYGDAVRVVQIGGNDGEFDGYSMELCGGTHRKSTGDLGFFRVRSEGAIAAGIRRIEAVCGEAALGLIREKSSETAAELTEARAKLDKANEKLVALERDPVEVEAPEDLPQRIETHLSAGEASEANALLNQLIKTREEVKSAAISAEKALKKAAAGAAASLASQWYEENLASLAEQENPVFVGAISDGSPALLQEAMNTVKARQFSGAVALAVVDGDMIHFGAVVHPDQTKKFKAGDIVRQSLAEAGGKGGGKPEMARGAAKGARGFGSCAGKSAGVAGG